MRFLPHFFNDADCLVEQAAPLPVKARPPARDGHVLARAAEGNDIHGRQIGAGERGHIAVVLHPRQTLCGHANGKGLHL